MINTLIDTHQRYQENSVAFQINLHYDAIRASPLPAPVPMGLHIDRS